MSYTSGQRGLLYQHLLTQLELSTQTSLQEMKLYHTRALYNLATFAQAHTQYYRRHLPFFPQNSPVQFWRQWADVPILSRARIQQMNDALMVNSVPSSYGALFEDETSGSTGTPLKCRAAELEQVIFEVTDFFGHTFINDRDLRGTLCVIKSFSHNLFSKNEPGTLSSWGRVAKRMGFQGQAHVLNLSTAIKDQLRWLAHCQPRYLATTPSNLCQLAEEAVNLGDVSNLGLKQALTFGEMVSRDLRRRIKQVFGAQVADTYSAIETGIIAIECRFHNYHIAVPNVYVEVINENGQRSAVGEAGRVIVTPLYKFAMPLIRYDLGDYAVAGGTCRCGIAWPTIQKIKRRQRNMFKFPDGTKIWPALNSYNLQQYLPFSMCEIAQIAPLRIELRVAPMTADCISADIAGLTNYVRQRLGQPVSVTVKPCDRIPGYGQRKFEDYVCEITE
jgi:phenylacetate-CoA ligase